MFETTASVYPRDPAVIRARLAEHLVKPLRLSRKYRRVLPWGKDLHRVRSGNGLASLAKSILGTSELILHTDEPGGASHLLMVLSGR